MRISAREVVLPMPGGAVGVFRRRLTDEHILDIYLVVDAVTSSISLEVEGLTSGLRLPLVELGDVLDLQISDHLGILKIELLSENYLEVFQVLVDDLVDSAIKNQGPEAGGTAIMQRLHRWERLLEASRHGLSNSAQKGLLGELMVLECISDAIGMSGAVEAWLGPESGVRDFEIGEIGIEVKTTAAKGALSVKISSERQLETIVINQLFLWCISIEKVAQGLGLNETVNRLRALIGSDLVLAEKFEKKLMQIGYLADDMNRYKSVFAIREMFIYRVDGLFPKIVSSDIQDCISEVNYRIFLEGCAEWAVEKEELIKELKID